MLIDNDKRMSFWSQPLDQVQMALHSTSTGLSSEEARRRLQQVGANTLKAGQSLTAVALLLNQFKSPLVLILKPLSPVMWCCSRRVV
jgi:Ca2+-transporting ATPase